MNATWICPIILQNIKVYVYNMSIILLFKILVGDQIAIRIIVNNNKNTHFNLLNGFSLSYSHIYSTD